MINHSASEAFRAVAVDHGGDGGGGRLDDRWDELMQSMDLLIVKVGSIDTAQQQMIAHVEINLKAVNQVMQDQQLSDILGVQKIKQKSKP